MFTIEQKVDLIMRYIATTDIAQRDRLQKLIVDALNEVPSVDAMIVDLLKNLGVSQRLLGYKYITHAIKLCIQDPTYLKCLTTRLYPDIADAYGTKYSSVEHCMRHAVISVFISGDLDVITSVFGNAISGYTGKVTTGEFIETCTNEITRKMKKFNIEAGE